MVVGPGQTNQTGHAQRNLIGCVQMSLRDIFKGAAKSAKGKDEKFGLHILLP
jgi:hypothetical protein